MSFFSPTFAAFFLLTIVLYFLSPHRLRVPVLLTASVIFYMSFIPEYIVFILGLIITDFFAAHLIERSSTPASRRAWLLLSLAMNFGFMASFKYAPAILGKPLGEIPLGLSFHTFQSTAYVIEVYRRRQAAEQSFLVFALYVMFFPQLAAGPIERPQVLLHQFREYHKFDYARFVSGLQQVAWGLFQKYVLANHFAAAVNPVYTDPSSHSGPAALLAALAFPFQILCDFAGYSDIAIGSASILGFRLSRNFNRPFQADSMAEYWKRWHISLSSWMRDYIFFPLCGHRPAMSRVCGAIIATFVLNGLWHGARWNYLISGLLHGSYRVVELLAGRALSRQDWPLPPFLEAPVRVARTILVFLLMAFAFMFVRGDSLTNSLHVISRIGTAWDGISSFAAFTHSFQSVEIGPARLLLLLSLVLLVHAVNFAQAYGSLRARIAAQPFWFRWSFYYAAAIALLGFGPRAAQPFIYFQF